MFITAGIVILESLGVETSSHPSRGKPNSHNIPPPKRVANISPRKQRKMGHPSAGGMKEVEKWAKKLKLREILWGETDGRSVSGMEKALARMDEKDEDRMAVANLKALCKSVKLCQYLCKAPIRTMPQEELVASFTELETHQVPLSESMMSAILTRKTQELMDAGDMQGLLDCMNPFVGGPDDSAGLQLQEADSERDLL